MFSTIPYSVFPNPTSYFFVNLFFSMLREFFPLKPRMARLLQQSWQTPFIPRVRHTVPTFYREKKQISSSVLLLVYLPLNRNPESTPPGRK